MADSPELIARWLRIPEAWEARQAIDPAALAGVDSPFDLARRMREAQPASGITPLAWDTTRAAAVAAPSDMHALLSLSAALADADARGLHAEIEAAVLANPSAWWSALALAWPELSGRPALARALISRGGSTGAALLANALLTSACIPEAATALAAMLGPEVEAALLPMIQAGQMDLARALAESPSVAGQPASVPGTRAARAQLLGDLGTARQTLIAGWEQALGACAQHGDRLADVSLADGDAVSAVEAVRNALAQQPTAERRARLALLLARTHRLEEARTWIADPPRVTEEHIAAAVVALSGDDPDRAITYLRQAVADVDAGAALGLDWLEALAGALETGAQPAQAAQVLVELARWRPVDAGLQARIAQAYLASGMAEAAARHALAAVQLQPDSAGNRRLLARSLRSAGKPDDALAHWQALESPDDDDHLETARCAIEAGKLDVATQVAESLLCSQRAGAAGLALLGRALMSAGRLAEARDRLEAACAADPRDPDAWTALAECQTAMGDPKSVGSTLAAAVQAAPGSAPVQHAYAVWLRSEGRTSEALQAAAKAATDVQARPEWVLEHGELLVELGHFTQAVAVLRAVLSKRPASWSARRTLAQALLGLGETAEAASLVGVLPESPDPVALSFAGHVLVTHAAAAQQPASAGHALSLLEQAVEAEAAPEVHIDMARALEILDRPEEALEHYRTGLGEPLALSPDTFRTASIGLARCALVLNRAPLAVHSLEVAAERHGASPDVQIALSGAYAAAGQHRRALQAAQRAAELAPDEASLRQLTQAASQAGESDLALQAVQRLTALQPTSPHVWLTLSEVCAQSQDDAQARAALARSLRLARADAGAWSRASELLRRFGRPASAQRALRKALYAAPQNAELVRQLAELSDESGDVVTAQRAWMRFADLRADQADDLDRAARALWLLDQRAVAVGLWQRAVSLAPDLSQAHGDLARAYLTEGDVARALEHYDRVLRFRPDDLGLTLEAAAAELHYGSRSKAVDMLRSATTIAPQDVGAWVALGEGLLMSGQPHEARQAFESARRLEPSSVRTLAGLAVAVLGTEDASTAAGLHASAMHQTCDSAVAAAALGRAAIALGAWGEALTALDRLNADAPSLASLRAAIELHVRLADAAWMYQAAGSRQHAPSPEVVSVEARSKVEGLLAAMAALAPAWEVDRLRQRTAVSFDQQDPLSHPDAARGDPSGEVIEGLAIAWLRRGRPANALALLAEGSAAGRWHALLRGLSQLSLGDLEPARADLEAARRDSALRPLAEHLIAQTYLRQGDAAAYAEHASHALVEWSDEPEWHFELAQAYLGSGQVDAALPHLTQAVDLAPDVPGFALALARTAAESGDLTTAMAAYTRLLATSPADGQVWKAAALCALAAGEPGQAAQWLEHARRLLPGDVECLVASARASLGAGDAREAQQHAQAAYSLAPESAQVLLVLGEVLGAQGKLDKALQAFDRALKRTEDPLPIHIARGELLVQIGRGGQAIEALKLAVAHDPESDGGWSALAGMHEAAGSLTEAVDAAARAVHCAPDRVSHRLQLGRLCRKTGQLDRALDELLKAQASGRVDPRVAFELGRIYEDRREFKRSLDAYQRAIEMDRAHGEAHFRAGLVLKQIKAYPQAGKMLRRAVELNPKDPEALHQLAAVRALELVHGGFSQQVVTP